jgi:TonB-linked SusC/RagA family outer membrane protein
MHLAKNVWSLLSKNRGHSKLLKVMKCISILLFAACMQASATGFSQVTLTESNVSLTKVFKKIQRQTGMDFLFNVDLLEKAGKVSVNVYNVSVENALKACLAGTELSFAIMENTVVVKPVAEKTAASNEHTKLPIPVSGRIVDESGLPLADVTVTVKGTNIGTVTDAQGNFSFRELDEKAILVFTAVNLQTFELPVNARRELGTLMLKRKVTETQEVVVMTTGYQTISRERVTGSYGKVTDEVLSKRPVANVADALNGQIAGVVRDPATGFVIRGRSSLSGNTNDRTPLLVVDGFPIEGGFETINPNDVKSIDVLKDAAATSIYGARASNGVIVITTKGSGTKGRANIQYNGFVSVGENIDLDYYMNKVDSKTHISFDDYFYNLYKLTPSIVDPWTNTTFRGSLGEYYTLLAERDKGNITQEYFDAERQRMLNSSYADDYYDYVVQNQVSQQHNIVVSGSSNINTYKLSFLYDNDKTYLRNNNNDRYMLGFGNSLNITPKIKFIFNGNLTFFEQENNGVNLSYAKSVTAPWTRVFDENGNYARHVNSYYEPRAKQFESRVPYSFRYNFVEESALRNNLNRGQDIRIQNELDFDISKRFRIRPMFQYEYQQSDSRSIYDEQSFAARNAANIIGTQSNVNPNQFVSQLPRGGLYRYNSGQRRNAFKLRIQADYNTTIGKKHDIAAVAGGEMITSKIETNPQDLKYGYSVSGLNYALFDYNLDRTDIFGLNLLNGPPTYEGQSILAPNTFSTQAVVYNERFVAGYANASYTYDKRYTLSASLRTDASNYISRSNRERFSPFFHAGFRWNLTNENFMRNVKFVDRLALRATYGTTGNAAGKTSILPFSVFSNQSPSGETGNYPTGAISGRQNDALTWEKTYSTNLGADFSLFRGKLTGTLDVYRRISEDLLTQVQTSYVIWSLPSQTINAAKVLNQGLEITLGTDMNISKGLNWNAQVNFDYNYNEVLEYNFLATRLLNYVGSTTFVKGAPTDRIFAVKLVGTSKDGYLIQEKKTGELVPIINSNYQFGGVGTIANTIPGMNIMDDSRIYYMGRSTPPMTLGFTNTFSWKGFSLMTVITGRFGHLVRRSDTNLGYGQGSMSYSATGMASLQPEIKVANSETGNIPPTLANRGNQFASLGTRAFYSDVTLESADHIRFNELYLGYDLPSTFLAKNIKFLRNATFYTQVRNLGILWTNNESGIDPEFIPGTIKPIRTFTFGARLGF